MIVLAAGAFVLLMTVVLLIARPFIAPITYEEDTTSLEQLRADRTRLRAQLRELDMDFETGKLANEEYEKLRARRLQQIERTTRAIRETEHVEPTPQAEPVEPISDAVLEARIAARKRALQQVSTCRECGASIDHDDRFCRRCGTDLDATAPVR
jgi:uncharacterized coiled-coil DUF342 family protein